MICNPRQTRDKDVQYMRKEIAPRPSPYNLNHELVLVWFREQEDLVGYSHLAVRAEVLDMPAGVAVWTRMDLSHILVLQNPSEFRRPRPSGAALHNLVQVVELEIGTRGSLILNIPKQVDDAVLATKSYPHWHDVDAAAYHGIMCWNDCMPA